MQIKNYHQEKAWMSKSLNATAKRYRKVIFTSKPHPHLLKKKDTTHVDSN